MFKCIDLNKDKEPAVKPEPKQRYFYDFIPPEQVNLWLKSHPSIKICSFEHYSSPKYGVTVGILFRELPEA